MSQSDGPTLDQFIELLSLRLLDNGATSAEFDDSVGMLVVAVVDGEQRAQMDLDVIDLHQRYVAATSGAREGLLEGAVAALRFSQAGLQDLLPDISTFVPKIETPLEVFTRERSGPDGPTVPDGAPDDPISSVGEIEEFVGGIHTPHRHVAPNLIATLGFETGPLRGDVNQSLLEIEGLDFEEALRIAYARLGTTTPQFSTLCDGVLFASWQDGRNECRLLEPRVFDELQLKGDPVVYVPSEGIVYVAGSDDLEGLRALAKATAKDYRSASARLCPKPMQLIDGEWRAFDPPCEKVPEFHTVDTLWATVQGNLQQRWMTSVNFENGFWWFPAGVTMMTVGDSDTLFSHTLWQRPLVTLLPKADYVSFFTEEMKMFSPVPWDEVFAVVGEPRPIRGFDPPRFAVYPDEFPSYEQLEALGSKCADLPSDALDEKDDSAEVTVPLDLEDPEQFDAFLEALRAAVEDPPKPEGE